MNHFQALLLCFVMLGATTLSRLVASTLVSSWLPGIFIFQGLLVIISLLGLRYLKVPVLAFIPNQKTLLGLYLFTIGSGIVVGIPVIAIGVFICGAFAEEITDRLFLFNALNQSVNQHFALLYSSLYFGLTHFSFPFVIAGEEIGYFLYTVALGAILGFVYSRLRSVFLVSTFHLYVNVFLSELDLAEPFFYNRELLYTVLLTAAVAFILIKCKKYLVKGVSTSIWT